MKVPVGMKVVIGKKKYKAGDEIPDNILPEKMKKKFIAAEKAAAEKAADNKQNIKQPEEKKVDKK